jgi:ADP-ribose pyrophosphatase YjhB (NUDIX family)
LRTGFYRLAFALARVWWFVWRPHTQGAVVAIWHQGRVLLVKSSYRRRYGLPGGFVKRGEASADAASRELAEELGVHIPPVDLRLAWSGSTYFEYRHDTTTVWEITLDAPPTIRVDGAEIVSADWRTPAEARSLTLSPPVASYLLARDGRKTAG